MMIEPVILGASATDLILTYIYVSKYKKWQPKKQYDKMETNPILLWCWKKFGLRKGSIIGSTLIFGAIGSLLLILPHWIKIVFLAVLILALINHGSNLHQLNKLMK